MSINTRRDVKTPERRQHSTSDTNSITPILRDAIYQQLVAAITQQHSTVSTRDSVEEVLDLFVQEVRTYTDGMDVEIDEEAGEIEEMDIFVDEPEGSR